MDDICQVYRCFCDLTRLRILNLLSEGPLCVCHIQEVIDEPQVKVSKHLAYLRKHGVVSARRQANWMIYRIADQRGPVLEENLKCLQDLRGEQAVFGEDFERLTDIMPAMDACAPVAAKVAKAKKKPATNRNKVRS